MDIKERDKGILGECVYSGRYQTMEYFIEIKNIKQSKELNKSIGKYYTINCSKSFYALRVARTYLVKRLQNALNLFLPKKPKTILVVGLGNAFLVADSLGASVVKDLFVTHNIPKTLRDDLGDLCALIPGVGGLNGFETFDIVKSVVDFLKPSCVIVVDAITTKVLSRIGCSFQFSSAGITPGAGVGNVNKKINSQTLGVPVVSIGVPLMLNADIFEGYSNFTLTPKEIDIYTKYCAKVVACAINLFVHGEKYKNYI